jgi:hypothetical protein
VCACVQRPTAKVLARRTLPKACGGKCVKPKVTLHCCEYNLLAAARCCVLILQPTKRTLPKACGGKCGKPKVTACRCSYHLLTDATWHCRRSEAIQAGWLTVLCADVPANKADIAKSLRRQMWQAQGECLLVSSSFPRSCNMHYCHMEATLADGAVC